MIADTDYVELLMAHPPAKPRNRRELAEMTALLESLSANETAQTPAMERFIETLTALILQYEEEIDQLRQVDLAPILGSKSYVSQILSGRRPVSREGAVKLAEFFGMSAHGFR